MSLWDSIDGKHNDFNLQEFIKFYNENKDENMNLVLQRLIQNNQVTQEQVNQATRKAQGILQMLQGLGIIK